MLQLEHGFGIEQMIFTISPPLVFTAPFQVGLFSRTPGERIVVAYANFLGNFFQPDAADARCRPGKVAVNKFLVQADGFKNLCSPVGLHG